MKRKARETEAPGRAPIGAMRWARQLGKGRRQKLSRKKPLDYRSRIGNQSRSKGEGGIGLRGHRSAMSKQERRREIRRVFIKKDPRISDPGLKPRTSKREEHRSKKKK